MISAPRSFCTVITKASALQTTFPRHVRCRAGAESKGEVEGAFIESLKAQKNLPLDPNKGSHVGGLGVSSASRGVMLDPELRPQVFSPP